MKSKKFNVSTEISFIIKNLKVHKSKHIVAFIAYIIMVVLSIVTPFIMMKIIDEAILDKNIANLVTLIILYFVLNTLSNLIQLLINYIYVNIGKKIILSLRYNIFKLVFKFGGEEYTKINTGDSISIMHNDIPNLENIFTNMIPSIITSILTSIGLIFFLGYIQPILLAIVLVIEIFVFYFQRKIGKKIKKENEDFIKYNAKSYSVLQELFPNIRNILLVRGRKFFTKKYLSNEKKLIKTNIVFEMLQTISECLSNQFNILITIAILGIGGYMVSIDSITLGGLIMFLNYSSRLLSPIDLISRSYIEYQQVKISINRILNFINTTLSISSNVKGLKKLVIKDGIVFRDVDFDYGNGMLVLNKINMYIKKGQLTSIIGVNGSGKTTLINLLLRFWDVTFGEIVIDNINIKKYNLFNYRKNIAVVSQDTNLFEDTLYNNIILENRDITYEQVVKCAKLADAYDFIMEMKDQFNTMINENGSNLSGGQRQKISFMRALLLDASIIIFDEATASMDNKSASIIEKTVLSLVPEKTVIFISHKMTLTKVSDIVYVFEKGCLVEGGKHDELMSKNGVYAKLYSLK